MALPTDLRARNFYRDLIAKALNNVFPGHQRNSTNRDARGFNETTDFGQNINFEELNEDQTVGFAIAGE
jgi:hypothetical protein